MNNNYKYCCRMMCKPCVILYNENLNEKNIHNVYKLKKKPKYLVVIGTTMQF